MLDLQLLKDNQPRMPGHSTAESFWFGTSWTCRKRRRHYRTIIRSGVKISVNDFVFVLAEESKRLVALLDDMYEDSISNKMVVVRWFHKIDEVGIILPHNHNDHEIFFSLCVQHLSVECIDGLATVLSPQHFEKFRSHPQLARLELFACQSLFHKDEVSPFDITQLKGYWKQAVLKLCNTNCLPKARVNSFPAGVIVTKPTKRLRSIEAGENVTKNLGTSNVDIDKSKKTILDYWSVQLDGMKKSTHDLILGSQVEVLSQDSGLTGCWFRAVVIKKQNDKVKVEYKDIKDAEDEAKNLQEWLPASRIALFDPWGLRLAGRTTIRPALISKMKRASLLSCPGTAVDVWWHDGWWEAIVLQKERDDKIRVYFPGEKQISSFANGDLRLSKDWVGKTWISVNERPDLVTLIFSSLNDKQAVETSNRKQYKHAIDDGKKPVNNAIKALRFRWDDVSKYDFFDQLKWKSSKR